MSTVKTMVAAKENRTGAGESKGGINLVGHPLLLVSTGKYSVIATHGLSLQLELAFSTANSSH